MLTETAPNVTSPASPAHAVLGTSLKPLTLSTLLPGIRPKAPQASAGSLLHSGKSDTCAIGKLSGQRSQNQNGNFSCLAK